MCALEFPDIETLVYQPYKDDGVLVYGLYSLESPDRLADFAQQNGSSFPLIEDTGGTRLRLSFPAGTSAPYPRDVIIGKDGTVRAIRHSFEPDELSALLAELVAE